MHDIWNFFWRSKNILAPALSLSGYIWRLIFGVLSTKNLIVSTIFGFRSVADGIAIAFLPALSIARQSLTPSVIHNSSPSLSVFIIITWVRWIWTIWMPDCLPHVFDAIITPWKGSLRLAQGNALWMYEEGNYALKGQKRYDWIDCVIEEVIISSCVWTLLPFQGVLSLCVPTQGVATLYPGLSAGCPFRASFAVGITTYNA